MKKVLIFLCIILSFVQSGIANTDPLFIVSDTAYLPLTAGNSFPLTGALHGTTAFFSATSSNALSVLSLNNGYSFSSGIGTASARLNFSRSTEQGYIEGGNSFETSDAHGYVAIGTRLTGVVSEKMRIDHYGNVGIGMTSAGYKLDVNGTANFRYQLTGASASFSAVSSSALPVLSLNNAYSFGSGAGTASARLNFSRTTEQGYIEGGNSFETSDAHGYVAIGTRLTGVVSERMRIDHYGNVGIGTASPSEKLSVNGNTAINGNIFANGYITTKKLTVTQSGWSDYVFDKDYKLRSLSSLETFIKQNKHLPEVPSANEVEEKGISVGDNQALLLKKVEELTLYIILLNKKIDKLKPENKK